MKLIKPNFEIIEQQAGLNGIYKIVELAGKVSHKSESNITEDSAKKFVDNMIKLGHGAPLEFGTIYLFIKVSCYDIKLINHIEEYQKNKYSIVKYLGVDDNSPECLDIMGNQGDGVEQYVITTNFRNIVENNWLDDLKYLCEPTEYHAKRYCVKFICDRGVSHEFVRHRTMSFLQESTRYCNYSSGRFNNEITCIKPSWMRDIVCNKSYDCDLNITAQTPKDNYQNGEEKFISSLVHSEDDYFSLLDQGWKPQQARQVLPNALKTELFMCGYEEDWKHFFSLRSPKYGAKGVHPDAAYLADCLYDEFIKEGFIESK